MKKKIFVGNLSWKVTEDALKPLFEAYGEVVSCKIVIDQYTKKSKGFGFVEMGDADAADASIKGLDKKLFMEREMRVSLAQERPPRREGDSFQRDSRGGDRGDRGDRGGERSFRPRAERSY